MPSLSLAWPTSKTRALPVVLVAAVLSIPTSVASAAPIYLPDCGVSSYGGKAKPKTWDAGCTGNLDLRKGKWSSWGGKTARGTGIGYDDRRTTITAYRIRTCRDNRGRDRRFYTRVRLNEGPAQALGCLR